MKNIETQINGTKVTVVAVEAGEKVFQVRESLGLKIGQRNWTALRLGTDFEDANDLEDTFSELADALAGVIDLDSLSAVIEIRAG